jgi:hypothetical protein
MFYKHQKVVKFFQKVATLFTHFNAWSIAFNFGYFLNTDPCFSGIQILRHDNR